MGVTLLVAVFLAQAAPEARSIAPKQVEAAPAPAEVVPRASIPASVVLRSSLDKRFRLVETKVTVDGQDVSHRAAPRGQELDTLGRIFEGTVRPGWHVVRVELLYEGRNKGPFTYLDDYKVRLESTVDFNFQEGNRPGALEVLAYEKPGATVSVENKPIMELKPAAQSGATAAVRPATP